ncbi:MAG: zinc-binding alcohol dehydrogenase [Alcaligenaceae bacterium]|nr:MAG: zinc-binding alcohol dehydrogenase [Alcaligenaceae bacterium]
MKSYWINKTPNGTELELREQPVPAPGPGQVLVRVRASSINRGDMMGAIKLHSAKGGRPAGVDGSGTVEALGSSVSTVGVGDRVMFRAKGCFSEYVAVEATLLTPVPACLNWEQAAVIPIAYITAYEAILQFGRVQDGEWVLVAGASSGVGVAAVQIAKICGAKVIGTSGSAEKLARLKALGLDAGIQTRGTNFAEEARRLTGGAGVGLAVNLVGGSAFGGCLEALTDFGRLAVVGYVDGQMLTGLDLEPVHGKRLQIFGLSNAPLSTAARAVAQRGFEREVMPAITDGRIVPVIDRTFSFDELPAAKQYVEQNTLLGKVAIRFA